MAWNLARKKPSDLNKEDEIHFQHVQDIDSLINFDEGNEPDFYWMVLSDTHLNNVSKSDFIDNFWNKYKNPKNIKFRKSVVGKYLFWLNKEFIGVINSIDDVDDYGNYSDDKFIIQISNDYIFQHSNYL